jgi:hypothetical protein
MQIFMALVAPDFAPDHASASMTERSIGHYHSARRLLLLARSRHRATWAGKATEPEGGRGLCLNSRFRNGRW